MFNKAYFNRISISDRTLVKPFTEVFSPLDKINAWNKLYGKACFHQFQCVVSVEQVSVLKETADIIAYTGIASRLADIKRMGPGLRSDDRGRWWPCIPCQRRHAVYGSAKAGFHTYLSGLRNHLTRAGGHVATVKPGFVDTAMTWWLEGMFLVATPGKIAADRKQNVICTRGFWKITMTIVKSIPESIFKKLSVQA